MKQRMSRIFSRYGPPIGLTLILVVMLGLIVSAFVGVQNDKKTAPAGFFSKPCYWTESGISEFCVYLTLHNYGQPKQVTDSMPLKEAQHIVEESNRLFRGTWKDHTLKEEGEANNNE